MDIKKRKRKIPNDEIEMKFSYKYKHKKCNVNRLSPKVDKFILFLLDELNKKKERHDNNIRKILFPIAKSYGICTTYEHFNGNIKCRIPKKPELLKAEIDEYKKNNKALNLKKEI